MNNASSSKPEYRKPWAWVPSLYFAEGIPYVVVMTVSVIMYKRLGISNTDIALYTSWLYLPWVIKPLWSPFLELFKTKRFWIVSMQLLIGGGLAGVALTLPLPSFFTYSLAFLWLLAFSSATHDIAADGFYMLALTKHDQALFVGIRSTFYRIAMITGQGLLIILAGFIESSTGLPTSTVAVHAAPNAPAVAIAHPGSYQPALGGEYRVITVPDALTIPAEKRNKHEVDSIIAMAKQWNVAGGFVKAEAAQAKDEGAFSLWWKSHVSTPLTAYLKEQFGPEQSAQQSAKMAGSVGVAFIHLSQQPEAGKELVVTLGLQSGENINLVEGTRLVFNETNWNKPAMAVFQTDPKLTGAATADFIARSGNIPLAWSLTFFVIMGVFLALYAYHRFILPYPAADTSVLTAQSGGVLSEFMKTFAAFFKKEKIGVILAFLLLFRFAEAQLVKLASPFLLDMREVGGLALTTGELGLVYGTIGIIMLTIGGILGGLFAAKYGLKATLWIFVFAIHLPDLAFVYLSYAQPQSLWTIIGCVGMEQFGYGFGFTAYMLYMLYISEGQYKTAHYAICTGFMALGMMLPGMFSGWLQETIGYQHFFVWVILSTIPGFLVAALVKIDPLFGKKTEEQH